jgi:serine/threonine-protein kinase
MRRAAQLVEANRDLDRALQAGAGKNGRHTGRLAGQWLLGAVIGRGAMGEVYEATHENGQSRAAVKTLVSADPDQLLRFRREAEIAAKVRSPGLVTLYEAGVIDDSVPFLVMELLTGHDLSWHLRKSRQLDLDEVVALVDQVAAGLYDAHAAGIVHRDIKPQNLFRHEPASGGPATWKILDFGVSKLTDSSGTLTQNMIVGTPGYMAPEQARGLSADARSDLFALGAVVYRSLTAQPAFKGNDTPAILFDVVYRAPRRPSELVPSLPEDMDRFLAIALAKRPADRFVSAGAFADALRVASKGGLPRELRLQADLLLAALPWGGRVRSD